MKTLKRILIKFNHWWNNAITPVRFSIAVGTLIFLILIGLYKGPIVSIVICAILWVIRACGSQLLINQELSDTLTEIKKLHKECMEADK